MPTREIQWGTGFENKLVLGELFDVLTDREMREGSEQVQAASGVEDAWITGRDYTLEAEARWIPFDASGSQTPISGPAAFQDFLDWARDKNTFRLVPDQAVPDFYVDGCYLVEPLKGFGALTQDLKRKVRLKLRNPTVDFMQALRGIMFEYAPGMSLSDPVAATYTRALATTQAKLGLTGVEQVAANILRDRHYYSGIRATLIDKDRVNNIPAPDDFSDVSWGNENTTVSVNDQVAPDGTTTMDRITDDATNGRHTRFRSTGTAGVVNRKYTVIGYFQNFDAGWAWFGEGGGGLWHRAWVNLSTGAVGTTANATARVKTFTRADGSQWFRVAVTFTRTDIGNLQIFVGVAANGDGIDTYAGTGKAIRAWRIQFGTGGESPFESEGDLVGGGVTSPNDNLQFPWVYPAQDKITVYVELARPIWADLSGGLAIFPDILSIGTNFALLLHANESARQVRAELRDPSVVSSAYVNLAAGNPIKLCAQYENLKIGGKCRADGGNGSFGGDSASATAPTTITGALINLGMGPNTRLSGGIAKVKVAPDLFTAAQMAVK